MSGVEVLARAEALRRDRTPYVLATVVRAERPTSAKPGDAAVILADGTIEGFVGGVCAESTVRSMGLRLLASGASTLLRITPEAVPPTASGVIPVDEEEAEGLVVVSNPCLSGGSLEIFLQAMLPAPLVRVHGEAPVARALLRVGDAAGFDMVAAHPGDPIAAGVAGVVVATHGRDEEAVLRRALDAGVSYVALVASRRRGDAVLAEIGAGRDRVRTPAGLDIGARTAPEIAVSILAELIEHRSRTQPPPEAAEQPAEPTAHQPAGRRELPLLTQGTAIDPVCGMTVQITPTTLVTEHEESAVYFCAAGCKAAFLDDPRRYLPHG
ncbi:MAG: YHS domain-containing protein [Hamadaea sp.]|nr:YHS domain-containing protein [Hamadaea sp.]